MWADAADEEEKSREAEMRREETRSAASSATTHLRCGGDCFASIAGDGGEVTGQLEVYCLGVFMGRRGKPVGAGRLPDRGVSWSWVDKDGFGVVRLPVGWEARMWGMKKGRG